jgi:hypothetical protein
MEPLSSAAIAVATLLLTKMLEKTGENIGDVVSSQVGELWQFIKRKPLTQSTVIEQGDQPVDFGQAVLEIESAATTDLELAQAVDQLAAIVKADPTLLDRVQTTAESVKQEPTLIQNNVKLAEKIGMVVQGGTVNLDNMSF